MNFRFKLSQRLARLKATLAVSVVLALACQSDLTDPKPPYSSPRPSSVAADLTPLTAASVVASGNDGNLPQNTVDKSLATRWSAQGDGQWIRYDLGALVAIDHLDIAWYLGDTRIASFDIQVSPDTVTWTKVFSGQSSGQTLQFESYAFPTTTGRYVRIVGHGNNTSTWNSVTEVAILGMALPAMPVASVVASGNDGNLPQNTVDNNLATRWSAQGDGQWIRYDLGALAAIDHLDIAWYLGDTRASSFDIQVSLDTVTWTKVFSGQSSGQTLQLERYAFPTTSGRYLRIVGHGNNTSTWNSITEVAILGTALPALPVASVVASANDGNVPQNTLDKSLATRWSAQGDGQWIQYDIGALTALNRLSIAWYLGDSRVASFDIAASLDAVTWTNVFSGQSSGTTLQPELYTFPTAAGRYVRIVGHGNSLSAWTSITEVAIIGTTTITAPSCVTSTAAWQNVAIPSQTGAFEVPFDATPSTANMDGVVGLANGPAADYTNLAPIVRFNPTGTIDARNGGDYAAATAIPYTPGTTYHFRLDVNLASHTYDIYVTPAGAVERLLGWNFAFRTEQAALSVLNNLGLYAKVGSATVCNPGVSAWTPPAPTPVASVAVSPATASPQVGQTVQLAATPKDSGGSALTGRTVTWTSGNTSMVTVSSSGLVKGVAAGTATIMATTEGKAGSAAVTVTLVPVASVVVSPAPATLPLHGTIQLGVTLKDASGNPLTGRTVAWTSSTPTIMTVSATGLVTDVADGGTATITATSEGKSGTSAVTVQAPLPSGSVPDPTLLPVASGQAPNVAAYTALNVASR